MDIGTAVGFSSRFDAARPQGAAATLIAIATPAPITAGSIVLESRLRFIELMPLVNEEIKTIYFPAEEMWNSLTSLGKLEPCSSPMGEGPARYYRFPDAEGTIGFITPVSEHFCFKCNRLRLTADGRLLPCLLSDEEIDLRPALR